MVWALMLIVPGIPVAIMGMVYPSRRVVAWAANLWARTMLVICGVRLTVEGRENLSDVEPRFHLGNHQGAIDIAIIIHALKGDVRLFSKDTLFLIPIFGWIMRRYGYISVDKRSARTTLQRIDRILERFRKNPISMAVFAEGTRTRDGGLLPFRRGIVKICQRAGLPVVPFCINGSYRVNPRDRWAMFPGPVRLTFGRPIPAAEVLSLTPAQLHDRVRGAIAEMLDPPAGDPSSSMSESTAQGTQSEQRGELPATAHS